MDGDSARTFGRVTCNELPDCVAFSILLFPVRACVFHKSRDPLDIGDSSEWEFWVKEESAKDNTPTEYTHKDTEYTRIGTENIENIDTEYTEYTRIGTENIDTEYTEYTII